MPTGHYDQNSAMRSVSYVVGKSIKFGRDRNQSPNWEVEVGRGVPWFGATELAFDDDRGVNIAGVVFEWLTDDFTALGWPEAWLDEDSFEALRSAVDDDRISPLITEQVSAESAFAQLFEYRDLWCRSGPTGKFEIGRWQHGNIDTSGLPIIGSDDLTEEPDLSSNGLADTVNLVRVRFKDREHYYNDGISVPAFDAGNFRKTGIVRDIVLDRPWITDAAIANRYAAEYLAIFSKPLISGTIKVKWASLRALGIREGDLFKVDSAALELEFVFRCLELELPATRDGVCTLTIENERGIWPTLYIPPPAGGPGNFVIVPAAIVHKRVFELPVGLKTSAAFQIAILAQRPGPQITGFRVHVSADDATYDLVSTQFGFAAYGKVVNANYPDSTADLDTTVGIQFELFGVDNITSLTDTQRDNDVGLIVINNEVMSRGQVIALGAGKYKAYVRRARFGTAKSTHLIDTDIWFIHREFLNRLENRLFIPDTSVWFKLQPFTGQQMFDLTLVTPFSYLLHSAPAVGSVYNLALTSNAYVDEQGERHTVILAAWDYLLDQNIILFGVAYRRTSSDILIRNAEQDLSFSLSAAGLVPGQENVNLGDTGTTDPATLIRLWNEEQSAWLDVICTGPAGQEVTEIIPAVDGAPGTTRQLFVPGQNLWFDLLCVGPAGQETLDLSDEGTPARPATPSSGEAGSDWDYIAIDTPDVQIPVTAGVAYDVKVRAINAFGDGGEYCPVESIIAGEIDLFEITDLEIAGQGADHNLHGVDCHLAWSLVSPAQGTTIQGGPNGTSSGQYDPGFIDFEIKIYEGELTLEQIESGEISPGVPIVKVWRDVSDVPEYNFTLVKNIASVNGPHPLFTVWVGGFDAGNRAAAPQVMTVTVPLPDTITQCSYVPTIGGVNVYWTHTGDPKLAKVRIHRDVSPLVGGYLIAEVAGNTTQKSIDGLTNPSTGYSFYLEVEDVFGQQNFPGDDSSTIYPAFPGLINPSGANPIIPISAIYNDLAEVGFSPSEGVIETGEAVTLSSVTPNTRIYYRMDATEPDSTDTLYTAPIPITVATDITARSWSNGFYGPAVTRHFDPSNTAGDGDPGGASDRAVAPTFNPASGSFVRQNGILPVVVSHPNLGFYRTFYTLGDSLTVLPPTPTHDGAGLPTGGTLYFDGPSTTLYLHPTTGNAFVKAMVFKPAGSPVDSVIALGSFQIYHVP